VAFEGLVGKEGTVTPAEMQAFTDFVLEILPPPNPVRALGNSLTTDQQEGANLYGGPEVNAGTPPLTDTVATCEGCHTLNPALGFFGSGGKQSFEGEPQNAKVPHLRNAYAKVGMFGVAGNQVRGFGFLHDGAVPTVFNFLTAPVFNFAPGTTNQQNEKRRDLERYALAFPTDLAPIVGQQVTLSSSNGSAVNPRIDLMIQRAGAAFSSLMLGGVVTECDLVVKGSVGGDPRGWVRESGGLFRDDTNNTIADAALRALATSEGPLTYTCAPPGSGTRMGINRDGDLHLDGLDNCPAVPNDPQTDTNMNGIGDACEPPSVDTDLDGVPDSSDNCPGIPNPLQEDFDGDGQGDACDADDDNDGLADSVETNTGIFVSSSDTGSDPLSADTDGDGLWDGTEVVLGTDPNTPNVLPVPALPGAGLALLLLGLLGVGAWSARRWQRPA
jgi:hypothetical protein